MSDEDYIDFKKEFEDFKKELENSKPLFEDDDISFTDFDDYSSSLMDENLSKDEDIYNNNEDLSDFPKITLEDDNILVNLIIKKDYSKTDEDKIKEELLKDLNNFIDEFSKTDEFEELINYYNQE